MAKQKAMEVAGGHCVKRKARIEHECHDCWNIIEPGEEYYQLTWRSYSFSATYITKHICESCWKGRELEA